MSKHKKFISVPVVASVLAVPAVALAGNGDRAPLSREQVRADVTQKRPIYNDRTSACVSMQYPIDLQVALARVAAQRQLFASYGGMSSSSVTGRLAFNDHVQVYRTVVDRGYGVA